MKAEHIFKATVTEVVNEDLIKIMPHNTDAAGFNDEMVVHLTKTEVVNEAGDAFDKANLSAGRDVELTTNGIMTMSLPPQINPLELKVLAPTFEFNAKVIETKDRLLVEVEKNDSPAYGQVVLNVKEPIKLKKGDHIVVTFNGMMTRSMPAQINALTIKKLK